MVAGLMGWDDDGSRRRMVLMRMDSGGWPAVMMGRRLRVMWMGWVAGRGGGGMGGGEESGGGGAGDAGRGGRVCGGGGEMLLLSLLMKWTRRRWAWRFSSSSSSFSLARSKTASEVSASSSRDAYTDVSEVVALSLSRSMSSMSSS